MDTSTEQSYYVYLKCDFEGIPRYVGKGKGRRALFHERLGRNHPNKQLRRLILKAQDRGEKIPTYVVHNGLTEEEAFDMERCTIAFIGRYANGGTLYNWTDGGDGISGYRHTPETKELSRRQMEDPVHRAKMRAGRDRWLAEFRARKALEAPIPKVPKSKGHQKGIPKPPGTGAKISAAKMGKRPTETALEGIRAGQRHRREREHAEKEAIAKAAEL